MKRKNLITVIILLFSFMFEGIFSNFISMHSIFLPLFTLMALIIIYPLINNNSSYYKYCFVTGILYDLIYTNTIVIHGLLFLLLGFIISRLNLVFSVNVINIMLIALIVIILYRIIFYSLLLLTGNIIFDLNKLLESIYLSLISNLIFVVILNIITDKISSKLRLYKGI